MSTQVRIEDCTDLSTVWDPDASRLARVHISGDRIEIVLTRPDRAWVKDALQTLADTKAAGNAPTVVVAGPE